MQSGADEELAAIFHAHFPRLVRGLALAGGDPHLADDAVCEAFVAASRRWNQIREYDDPVGWIRRVAINKVLDDRRARRRRHRTTLDAAAREARIDTVLATDGARLDVQRALADLAPGQRTAVCLYYLADLSVGEVADAMGVSAGTVKSQLSAARGNLKALLQETEP